jgi:hypothetical protein
MKKQPKLAIIKPVLGTTGVSDTDFLARLNKVLEGITNNPAYPSPPIDMAGFKAAIDAYQAAITAALEGGKAAITARDKRRADVTIMYRLLGHYVESACKADMNTFVTSGFIAHVPAPRSAPQPVAVPAIGSIDQGSTGQLLATIKPVAKARSYDLRYATVPAAGAAAAAITWTMITVANVKPATAINNLTPGTTYQFQVRAFGKLGFSDWSDTVNKMCT